jgi:hypothetical protein
MHDNYYSQFYHPFRKLVHNRLLTLIRQFFLIPNKINELMSVQQLPVHQGVRTESSVIS